MMNRHERRRLAATNPQSWEQWAKSEMDRLNRLVNDLTRELERCVEAHNMQADIIQTVEKGGKVLLTNADFDEFKGENLPILIRAEDVDTTEMKGADNDLAARKQMELSRSLTDNLLKGIPHTPENMFALGCKLGSDVTEHDLMMNVVLPIEILLTWKSLASICVTEICWIVELGKQERKLNQKKTRVALHEKLKDLERCLAEINIPNKAITVRYNMDADYLDVGYAQELYNAAVAFDVRKPGSTDHLIHVVQNRRMPERIDAVKRAFDRRQRTATSQVEIYLWGEALVTNGTCKNPSRAIKYMAEQLGEGWDEGTLRVRYYIGKKEVEAIRSRRGG